MWMVYLPAMYWVGGKIFSFLYALYISRSCNFNVLNSIIPEKYLMHDHEMNTLGDLVFIS